MHDPFKPFHLMTSEDYASIGLKCGLEVHQQLLTDRKLFCRCPAGRYGNEYDAEMLRHMRPTLSELGEYDGTALMEKKTRKNIYYRIHHATVCTYEMDDTPPFLIDDDALDIALEMAILLRLNLVGELHVARKQYLDGSIPAGFQRTTILGVDGWIPFEDRKIRIAQLGLEEDSCREVSDVGHDRVYNTDRLGMPLIEVVTYPDMRTPEEAAAVGQVIRKLCRSTGRMRTGYGAARQDVNVSISGGTRIEIKGVPQISRIPHLVYNEAMRQCSLLRIRDELKRRGIKPDDLAVVSCDVTRQVAKAQFEPVRKALDAGKKVRCAMLKGFGGLLNEPTQEHTTFAREFADRIRVIACLTHLPNMVHSDTASESLSGRHWKDVRRKMHAEHDDALILVWGDERDLETACSEIEIRAREAVLGVPSDTRQAHKDDTNGFERVLPGPERMYPDTDLPPLVIDASRRSKVQARMPAYFWDREETFRKMRLPEDTIGVLSISLRVAMFQRIVDELGVDPVFVAVVLVQRFKAWWRDGLDPDSLPDELVYEVFRAHAEGSISREGVRTVFTSLLSAERCELVDAVDAAECVAETVRRLGITPVSSEDVDCRIQEVLAATDAANFRSTRARYEFMVGQAMQTLFGRAEARVVAKRMAEAVRLGCEVQA